MWAGVRVEFNDLQVLMAAVRRECALVFAELGWEAVGSGPLPRFTRPGSAEIVYQLDISWGVGNGIGVQAAVGVRHVTVCELIGQFTGELSAGGAEESDGYLYPVFHYGLPYVMALGGHETRDWQDTRVRALDDVARVVDNVRADLDAYGLPFLAGYSTLADVIGFLERQTDRSAFQTRALAVAQALAGRIDDALATLVPFASIHDALATHPGLPYFDSPIYRYKPFFTGFVAHFNIEPSQLPPQVARYL